MNAKTNLKIGAAIAALFAATAISHAADAVFEPAPVAPAAPFVSAPINTWEGGYAGAAVGYGFSGKSKASGGILNSPNSIGTDGFVGGVFGGWNGQSDQFVYGVEGDIGYNGNKGSNAGQTAKNGMDGSLRARLGMAVNEDVLVYATAGGAGGSVKVTDDLTGASDKNTQWGWTAGVGTDVKVTEQAFGRLEYRYTDLGSKNFDFGGGDVQSVKTTNHKILLGVGMKF